MGLFGKLNARSKAKVESARQDAYDAALKGGASEQDARAAGDEAARGAKRRRRALLGSGGS